MTTMGFRWPRLGRTDWIAAAVCAVGVGVATLAYAALDAVLLRPLPYAAPERIVRLVSVGDDTIANRPLSLPLIRALAERVPMLEAYAAADEWDPTITSDGEPEYLAGASVTAGFFDVFGARPVLGRLFDARDDRPGHDPVVVLSHDLWQRRFAGAHDVVGRSILLNGIAYTVVGVAPATWEEPGLVDGVSPPMVWRASPSYFAQAPRDGFSFSAVARIRAGTTVAAVHDAVQSAGRAEIAAFPDDLQGRGDTAVVPLLDAITGNSAAGLRLGLVAALAVWLIALANATNLLLLRALEQRKRIALCRALGASDRRLLGQVLRRQVALATVGGAIGLALAALAIAGIRNSPALAVVPRLDALALDAGTAVVALALSMLLGAASGLVAAVGALRTPIALITAQEARSSLGARSGARRQIVVAQLALATTLVATTLVLFAGYRQLARTDLGIAADATLAITVRAGAQDWSNEERLRQFWSGVVEDLAARPGVAAAGAISIAPLANDFSCDGIELPDAHAPLAAGECAETRIVAGDYFDSVGQVLVQGRAFSATLDRTGAADGVIVSQTTARRYWPGLDALGRRLRIHERDRTVVGIVGDVRHFGPGEAVTSMVYLPVAQEPTEKMTLMVRGANDAVTGQDTVRDIVQRYSPGASVILSQSLASLAGTHAVRPRSAALVIGAFTLAGAVLALVGLFSVVDYFVVRRRAELALRMAVGARGSDLRRLVVADAARLALAGGALGAIGAAFAAPWLGPLVPGISAADPRVLGAAVVIMALAAAASSIAPASRAARTAPTMALRGD